MGKKLVIDGIEIELDDDIDEADLDNHPEADNALSDDVIYAIEAQEGAGHR